MRNKSNALHVKYINIYIFTEINMLLIFNNVKEKNKNKN